MTDDDFARFMGKHVSTYYFPVMFIICIVMVCLLAWSMAGAEECGTGCTGTAWRLELNGEAVEAGINSEAECRDLADEIEYQTPPFSRLTCVEYPIARQDS